MCGWNRDDDLWKNAAAHLQNTSGRRVGVAALTPAESERCQSAVGPGELSNDG